MKNKFIKKWLVVLTTAAMIVPAGLPVSAETMDVQTEAEEQKVADVQTAAQEQKAPDVQTEVQEQKAPDVQTEVQEQIAPNVQAAVQSQPKQDISEAVQQNTEKVGETLSAGDTQTGETTVRKVQIAEQTYPTLAEAFAAAKDGDVLRLLENTEVSQPILSNKYLTTASNLLVSAILNRFTMSF